MCNRIETINRYTVVFQLEEALDATGSIVRDLDTGEYSTDSLGGGLAVMLTHILGHLCVAWHRRMLGPDEVMSESQEEYEERMVSVPNWGGGFRLVDITASHPAIDFHLSRQEIAQDTVSKYLRAAEAALRSLVSKVESGQFDTCCITLLANEFEPIVQNLCLAWHLRYLSNVEVSRLDPTVVAEVGAWLPPWEWNLHLTAAEERTTR